MSKYAEKTSVNASRSVEEIERILKRYGATQFGSGRDDEHDSATVMFKINGIAYRLSMPIPNREELKYGARNRKRTTLQIDAAWEQIYRQRWRAMALVIKARLEAVECGISTFEQEFMTNIMLPGGRTVRDLLTPQLTKFIEAGELPVGIPLLGYEGKK
jgi:hypothetical protein